MFLPILAVILTMSNLSVGDSGYIISSRAYLYSEASFSSEKVMLNDEEVVLYHGQNLTIIAEQDDFVQIELTYNGENIEGFVYKYYVTNTTSQTVYPVFNGSVRRDTMVYDVDFQPQYNIKSGQEVYIYSGYDDDDEYTAVQVVLEDGSLYNGYVLTQDLQPRGVSPLLIVGISIIAACVTVVLSLIFIKKVKKNKK